LQILKLPKASWHVGGQKRLAITARGMEDRIALCGVIYTDV
jgi:hypothetical protein